MSTEDPIKIGPLAIPPQELARLALWLLKIIRRQDEEVKALKDELHKLKGRHSGRKSSRSAYSFSKAG